jgi:hypothetical protein
LTNQNFQVQYRRSAPRQANLVVFAGGEIAHSSKVDEISLVDENVM